MRIGRKRGLAIERGMGRNGGTEEGGREEEDDDI